MISITYTTRLRAKGASPVIQLFMISSTYSAGQHGTIAAGHMCARQQSSARLQAGGLECPLVLHTLTEHQAQRESTVKNANKHRKDYKAMWHLGVVEEDNLDGDLCNVAYDLLHTNEIRRCAQSNRPCNWKMGGIRVEGKHVPHSCIDKLEVQQHESKRRGEFVVTVSAGETHVEEQLAEDTPKKKVASDAHHSEEPQSFAMKMKATSV